MTSYASPVFGLPFSDWCRRHWPGRAMSNAIPALRAGRAFIILSGGQVWNVSTDWSRTIFIHYGRSAMVQEIDCAGASPAALSYLVSCLSREAAFEAARRLNSLAASLRGSSVARRYEAYEDIANAAFCLWSALDSAWYGVNEQDESHPSRRSAALDRLWAGLYMARMASPEAARLAHEALAVENCLPLPAGDFDESYGRANLQYLFDAWHDSEDAELCEGFESALSLWAYRIYAPFAGPAPEGIEFPWHCAAASSHPQDAEPRFEDADIPSAPVRARAVRLA